MRTSECVKSVVHKTSFGSSVPLNDPVKVALIQRKLKLYMLRFSLGTGNIQKVEKMSCNQKKQSIFFDNRFLSIQSKQLYLNA